MSRQDLWWLHERGSRNSWAWRTRSRAASSRSIKVSMVTYVKEEGIQTIGGRNGRKGREEGVWRKVASWVCGKSTRKIEDAVMKWDQAFSTRLGRASGLSQDNFFERHFGWSACLGLHHKTRAHLHRDDPGKPIKIPATSILVCRVRRRWSITTCYICNPKHSRDQRLSR